MKSLKKISVFCFILISFVFLSQNVQACTCMERDIKKRWRDVDAVFEGRILTMKRLKKYEMSPYDDVPVEVVFEVSKTYKGFKKAESSKRFTLMTSLSQHTCAGYPFEIEKEYLIFAYKRRIESPEHWSLYKYPSGSYGTGGLCGGTKKLTDAKSDLASIRKWRENDREKAKGKGYGIPTEALPQFGF